MGDGRWGGTDTGGGRLNTRCGQRGGKKDERREETGKMFFEQGTRTNLGGGGKEGTKLSSDGKHRIFKNRDRV